MEREVSADDLFTVESCAMTPLPYEEEPSSSRQVVFFNHTSSGRPLAALKVLDRLQDDLRKAPEMEETKVLGGPLHRFWSIVTPMAAADVLDYHLSGSKQARALSKETNDSLETSECLICGDAFEPVTINGEVTPYYGRVVILSAVPLHADCAPTLATMLDEGVWENTDDILGDAL